MAAPIWAVKIVCDVAAAYAMPNVPRELTWWRTPRHLNSSGRASSHEESGGTLHVTAGRDRRDQKHTLLHELAHWLSPKREKHGPVFWEIAWDLYRRYKVPVAYTLEREKRLKGCRKEYERWRKERRAKR